MSNVEFVNRLHRARLGTATILSGGISVLRFDGLGRFQAYRVRLGLAECNSAIRQSATPRYKDLRSVAVLVVVSSCARLKRRSVHFKFNPAGGAPSGACSGSLR